MKIAIIASFLATGLALNAQMLQDGFVRVAYGDAMAIQRTTNTQNKKRFDKIDAPEKKHSRGDVSGMQLADLVVLTERRSTNMDGCLEVFVSSRFILDD